MCSTILHIINFAYRNSLFISLKFRISETNEKFRAIVVKQVAHRKTLQENYCHSFFFGVMLVLQIHSFVFTQTLYM